jgi:hypothetical protein
VNVTNERKKKDERGKKHHPNRFGISRNILFEEALAGLILQSHSFLVVNDGQQQEREESKDEKKGKGTHSHFW